VATIPTATGFALAIDTDRRDATRRVWLTLEATALGSYFTPLRNFAG
jgi:hypothetical protein